MSETSTADQTQMKGALNSPKATTLLKSGSKSLADGLDLSVLTDLAPGTFSPPKFQNTQAYRAELHSLFQEKNLTPQDRTWVLIFATMLRGKGRILNIGSQMTLSESQQRACNFISEHCVQWPHQEAVRSFPMSRICSSCPSVAALIWARLTVPERRTPDFFVQNTWAAQIRLSKALLRRQRSWEISRFGRRFNETYWNKKTEDEFPLVDLQGQEILSEKNSYSADDVRKWLSAM